MCVPGTSSDSQRQNRTKKISILLTQLDFVVSPNEFSLSRPCFVQFGWCVACSSYLFVSKKFSTLFNLLVSVQKHNNNQQSFEKFSLPFFQKLMMLRKLKKRKQTCETVDYLKFCFMLISTTKIIKTHSIFPTLFPTVATGLIYDKHRNRNH